MLSGGDPIDQYSASSNLRRKIWRRRILLGQLADMSNSLEVLKWNPLIEQTNVIRVAVRMAWQHQLPRSGDPVRLQFIDMLTNAGRAIVGQRVVELRL